MKQDGPFIKKKIVLLTLLRDMATDFSSGLLAASSSDPLSPSLENPAVNLFMVRTCFTP